MKTHCYHTYTYDELSQDQKENAWQWVRENWHDLYSWSDENRESLQAFCDALGLRLKDWEIDISGHSYIDVEFNNDDIEEMKGVRLWKYLQNNHANAIPADKNGHCQLTGYFMDDVLTDALVDFMARPDQDMTFRDLIEECLGSYIKAYQSDWQHAYSDQGIHEMLECNDYQYHEDGRIH